MERVVVRGPTIYQNQPGNHTVRVGTNLTLLCQLTIRDVAMPDQIVWFRLVTHSIARHSISHP